LKPGDVDESVSLASCEKENPPPPNIPSPGDSVCLATDVKDRPPEAPPPNTPPFTSVVLTDVSEEPNKPPGFLESVDKPPSDFCPNNPGWVLSPKILGLALAVLSTRQIKITK